MTVIGRVMYFLQNVIMGVKCEGEKYEESIKKSIKKMEAQNAKCNKVIDGNVGLMVNLKTIKDRKVEKLEKSYTDVNTKVHQSNRKLSNNIAKNNKVKEKLLKALED